MNRSQILSMLIVLLMTAVSCESIKNPQIETLEVGMTLPDFRAVDTNGEDYTRARLFTTGTTSLIVLFDTQCNDCRLQMPEIQKAYEADNSDTIFIGIARGADTQEVLEFEKEFGITFPLCPDKDCKEYSLFAKSVVPRIYISDTKTVIRFQHTDENIADEALLLNELQRVKEYGKDK